MRQDDTALCNDAADFFLDFQKDPILRTRRGSIAAQPQLFFIIRMIDGMPNDGTRVGVKVKIVDGIFPLFFFCNRDPAPKIPILREEAG